MATLTDIYNDKIMALAGNIPRVGHLANPDAVVTRHSRLCGSTITVELKMSGDVVTDYAHQVKACLLGQCAAAIMAHNIVGSTQEELQQVARQMRAMLRDNGPPPSGKWADLALLEPVRDYKARHASTLLVFDAVEAAMAEIQAKRNPETKGNDAP